MLMMQRRYHEAQVENQKARLLDPLSPVIAAQEGLWAYYSGDLDRLGRIAPALATDAPGFAFSRGLLGQYYLQRGEFAAAEREYRREAELLGPADDWPPSFLWVIAAPEGRSGEARKNAPEIERSPLYAAAR